MARCVVFPVVDSSQVGEARRIAGRFATELQFSEQQSGNLAIAATELANNLHRYGQDGKLILQALPTSQGSGIEILSIDSGPGMADVYRCLEDGVSTGGTPGNGLGAVRRLSDEFDIFSTVPGGTVVLSRIHGGTSIAAADPRRL